MTSSLRTTLALVAVIAVSAVLPLAGAVLRGPRAERCQTDGVSLLEAPRVHVVRADGESHDFCCVRCATQWLDAIADVPQEIFVTDAISGDLVDAATATFVRSRIYAQPATGDRVHAFATRAAAEQHADAYRGRVLDGESRPFGAR